MPWGRGLGQPLGLLLGRTACRGVRAGLGLLTVCCLVLLLLIYLSLCRWNQKLFCLVLGRLGFALLVSEFLLLTFALKCGCFCVYPFGICLFLNLKVP